MLENTEVIVGIFGFIEYNKTMNYKKAKIQEILHDLKEEYSDLLRNFQFNRPSSGGYYCREIEYALWEIEREKLIDVWANETCNTSIFLPAHFEKIKEKIPQEKLRRLELLSHDFYEKVKKQN